MNTINYYFYLLILVAFGIFITREDLYSQTVVELSPSKDALLQYSERADWTHLQTTNYGSSAGMMAMEWTSSSQVFKFRSVIDFDLSSIPSDASITGATLYLYHYEPQTCDNNRHCNYYLKGSTTYKSNACELRMITADWDESTVTYNSMPLSSTTSSSITDLHSSLFVDEDYIVDVTSYIQNKLANPSGDYGLMLKLVSETKYCTMAFASKENSNAALCPKLVVEYCVTPTAEAGSNGTTCVNKTYSVSGASASNYSSLSWSHNGTGSLSGSTTLAPIYTPGSGDAGNTVRLTLTANGQSTCSSVSDYMDITVYSEPTAEAGSDGTTCVTQPYSISGASASNYSSLLWSHNGTGSLSGSTTLTPTYTPATDEGYQTVRLTMTVVGNGNCETVTDYMDIEIISQAQIFAGNDASICDGNNYTIDDATGSGGSYAWATNGGGTLEPILGSLHPTYTPSASDIGNDVMLILLGYPSGPECPTMRDTMILQINPNPTVELGQNIYICYGTSTLLSAPEGTGFTYNWSPSTSLSCADCRTPTATPLVTTLYNLTVTSPYNCSSSDQVTVEVSQPIEVTYQDNVCSGDMVAISATGSSEYHWTPSELFSCDNCQNTVIQPTETTTYHVEGIADSYGCVGSQDFTVNVASSPEISGTTFYEICSGGSVEIDLSVTGGTSYSWYPTEGLSDATVSNPTANPTATTNYTIEATSQEGCSETAEVTIKVNSLPTPLSSENITLCLGESFTYQVSSDADWVEWEPTDGVEKPNGFFNKLSPTTDIVYTITVGNGDCEETATLDVSIGGGTDARFLFSTPGLDVDFTAIGKAESYTWNFGDGSALETTTTPEANHVYTQAGQYKVCLTTAGSCGSSHDCSTVIVQEDDSCCD